MTRASTTVGSDAESKLRYAAINRTIKNYQLLEPNGDKWQGPFRVSSLGISGGHEGAVEYTATLESAGEITFTEA